MSTFKNRLLFNIGYFLLWIGYFLFARFFFILFHLDELQGLDFITIVKTFLYGLKLDSSFSAYLCIIPFLSIILTIFLNKNSIAKIIKYYSALIIIFITLLLIIDANLYSAWGVRLDTSILPYLNTPKLMVSSASTFQLIFGTILWAFISLLFIKLFNLFINRSFNKIEKGHWVQVAFFLIVTASLILPVRGGLQTIPVNQSNVYFSKNMFANHTALNCIWNFFNTLTHKTDGTNPYKYFDDTVAKNIVKKSRDLLLESNTDSILNTTKPNIILILWESLSAKVVGSLDGETNVTPNLNKLSKEGILFTNFYGNGDRTDKAIPAILSGYYPQPVKRIMRMPNKTRSLPMLPIELKNLGYTSSFYYGGDMNFGNMNTFLRAAKFDEIIDGSEFDSKDWNSKWGAYDDVFMKRFAKDLSTKQKEPFFKVALTLSSHEPYEIRGEYKFGRKGVDNQYRSAHAYTDSVIGDFINFAKTQDWYQNTLIVIMGDHGHSNPRHKGPHFSPIKFQTPMLWLGGALHKKGVEVTTICSQVDFAYSLLNILGGDKGKFVFGHNIFSTSNKHFAHYIYNKGFGTISDNGMFVYDYVGENIVLEKGNETKKLDSLGKAITQITYDDFLKRK